MAARTSPTGRGRCLRFVAGELGADVPAPNRDLRLDWCGAISKITGRYL